MKCLEAFGFVEIFSGHGWVSRIMRTGGYPTASLDIWMGHAVPDSKQNHYDLTTDSGFLCPGRVWSKVVTRGHGIPYMQCELLCVRLALTTILNCKMDSFVCLIGLVCSSFVQINRLPTGDILLMVLEIRAAKLFRWAIA